MSRPSLGSQRPAPPHPVAQGPGMEAWPPSPRLPAGSRAHLSHPFAGKGNHKKWLRWPRSLFSLNPRKEKWPRLYILTEQTVHR